MPKRDPLITVALPMFRARDIGWLALEGLARQQCPYPWELIMVEEMATVEGSRPMHPEEREEICARLKGAGCVRVRHMALTEWIPLSKKWRMIGQLAAPTSITYILQAADCYSEPNRLKRSHEAIADGADWTHSLQGVFLDLKANERALYVHPRAHPTALNMAVRTDLVRDLPDMDRRKGVDRWLYTWAMRKKGAALRISVDTTEGWKQSLDTHGFNNISKWRGQKIASRRGTFHQCPLRISQMLPADVVHRLRLMTVAERVPA